MIKEVSELKRLTVTSKWIVLGAVDNALINNVSRDLRDVFRVAVLDCEKDPQLCRVSNKRFHFDSIGRPVRERFHRRGRSNES